MVHTTLQEPAELFWASDFQYCKLYDFILRLFNSAESMSFGKGELLFEVNKICYWMWFLEQWTFIFPQRFLFEF
jgi:hypothetical protein